MKALQYTRGDSGSGLGFHSPANVSLGCAQVAPLFHPLSCRHFLKKFFERHHHLTANLPIDKPLLEAADLPLLTQRWEFKVAEDHSQARILLPDSFSHDDEYTSGMLLDAAAIRRAHRANRTIVLHNFELYHRPIGLLALALMRAFGVYAQANVYYSPAGLASAVHPHQDAQSVFIVQCEGRKRWKLFDPPHRWRLRYNQRGKAGDVAPPVELQSAVDDVVLAPGDVLFVPRGMYHSTSTLTSANGTMDTASLHVTVGVETDTDGWTWHALLKDAASALSLPNAAEELDRAQWDDERLREALPLPLCRLGASFEFYEPHGATWLAHGRALLMEHVKAKPPPSQTALRKALDAALKTRQDYVERKRKQLLDFLALNPAAYAMEPTVEVDPTVRARPYSEPSSEDVDDDSEEEDSASD